MTTLTELDDAHPVCLAEVHNHAFTTALLNGVPVGLVQFARAGNPGIIVRLFYEGPGKDIPVEVITGPVQLFEGDPTQDLQEELRGRAKNDPSAVIHRQLVPYITWGEP